MREKKLIVLCVLLISCVGWSCSVRKIAFNEFADILESGISGMESDDDLEMTRDAFPATIKMLESFLINDPGNPNLLLLLSRLYASYTFGFLESDVEQFLADEKDDNLDLMRSRLKKYYLKGADYAFQNLIKTYPACLKELAKLESLDRCLLRVDKLNLPSLFWYGFNLGAYVNQSFDSIAAVAKAHTVKKIMERVIQLDEAYFNGAAHLFLLVYYAGRSKMMGGDPVQALHHYNRLQAVNKYRFLLGDLYYARFYLVQIQNKSAYLTTLQQIADYQEQSSPVKLFNAIAKRRVPIYIKMKSQYFLDDEDS